MIEGFIDQALRRSRATLSIMLFLIFAGVFSFFAIPVELEPNIEVPFIVVTVPHEGISPEDAERLLVYPLETELRSIEGIKEITSYAAEGTATVTLEFEIEIDSDDAAIDVREAVDQAQAKFPSTTKEPIVTQFSVADFPTIIVNFTASSEIPERTLYALALRLRDEIRTLPDVLNADLQGHREELLEVILDPTLIASYNISNEELISATLTNNRLIAAGALDAGQGRFSVKVPGLIETRGDLFSIPVKVTKDSVITLGDIATIRRVFKDREFYSHVNGVPAISIEVFKRVSANIIDTSEKVKALVTEAQKNYPRNVNIFYTSDTAPQAKRQIDELMGNVLTAMMLVTVMVIAALGLRSGLLVGLGIPVSFLLSYILLHWIGYTFNFMVMFGLLLALGMLIDGAIVVTEYADRKMIEGHSRKVAYALAAKRMVAPVTASTATTLAAFLPLFLWPGVSGKFMLHLPVTVSAVLAGSLAYALIFGPTIGTLTGKAVNLSPKDTNHIKTLEDGDPTELSGFTGLYARMLTHVIRYPILVTLITILVLVGSFILYSAKGSGVIFFADQDAGWASIGVRARGNLSVNEIRNLMVDVEQEIVRIPGVKSMYMATENVNGSFRDRNRPRDQIGNILLELHEPEDRKMSGDEVLEEIRNRVARLAGVAVQVQKMEQGPPTGKDVQIQLSSKYGDLLEPMAMRIRNYLETEVEGLRDLDDTRSLPGIEWQLAIDRARAAQLGANVTTVGYGVQLVTNGVKLGEYHPDDSDEEVDITARFPEDERGINALNDLWLTTASGPVSMGSFVDLKPKPKVDIIQRIDGFQVEFVTANAKPDVSVDAKVQEIHAWIEQQQFDPRVHIVFRGASEEQDDAGAFLGVAFLSALLLMFILLVAQFNSFYQAALIMFTVILSTAGVLLGLVITGKPFSVILTGVGIVALAGIVVNNNIILIDTYNHIRREFPSMTYHEVIIRTGAQRLRPVILTTVTTIFGLLPIANHLSIDFVTREIVHGSTVTSTWVPLASAIVSGLSFATLLTLIATPAMLALIHRFGRAGRLSRRSKETQEELDYVAD